MATEETKVNGWADQDHVPGMKSELMESLGRKVPTGYEDILRAYYRAIAEGR